jgi:toxin FitB
MKALLDSNIVIYLLYTQYAFLSDRLADLKIQVSEISRLEVLGFTGLTAELLSAYEALLDKLTNHAVTLDIIARAVALRRQRKMSLGDALIAATALERGLTLLTRNVRDFQWIPSLKILNPFDEAA